MNRDNRLEDTNKSWTPPHELRHSPPRPVCLSSGGVTLAVLAVVLVLGAIVGGPLIARESFRQAANYRAILAEGRETHAQVIRLWQKKGENKRNMVEYRFDVEGRTYRKEASVPAALWKTLKTGGPIRVTFLPANPELSHLYSRPKKPLPLGVAIAASAAGLGFATWIWLALLRAKEFLSQARVAPGVITKIQEVQTQHGGTSRTLHYEFPLLSGSVGKGKGSSELKDLKSGSVVCVIYDANRVGRNAIYPLQLVKVRRDT